MKRFIAGLIVGTVLALSVTSLASYQEISIYINGNKVETDVSPQIIDGRTMVPIRFVAEAFGAKVDWDGENRNVLINFAEKKEEIEGTKNDLLSLDEIAEEYAHYNLILSSEGNIYIGELGGEILFNWREEGTIINGRSYVSRDIVEKYLSGLERQASSINHQGVLYSKGELIEFTYTKIRVNNLSYITELGGFVADPGKRFALVEMEVWIEKYPTNKLEWKDYHFVGTFVLDNGQQIGGSSRYTGKLNVVEPLTWKTAYDAKTVRETDQVIELTVMDPISGQHARVVL